MPRTRVSRSGQRPSNLMGVRDAVKSLGVATEGVSLVLFFAGRHTGNTNIPDAHTPEHSANAD